MLAIIGTASPAVVSASAAIVVMVLAPIISSHRSRRDEVNRKLDLAVATLRQLSAARYSNQNVDDTYAGDAIERHRFILEIQEESLKRYISLTNEARLRLADIVSYVPAVTERLAGAWALSDEDVNNFIEQIETARVSAVNSERLLRPRKYPARDNA